MVYIEDDLIIVFTVFFSLSHFPSFFFCVCLFLFCFFIFPFLFMFFILSFYLLVNLFLSLFFHFFFTVLSTCLLTLDLALVTTTWLLHWKFTALHSYIKHLFGLEFISWLLVTTLQPLYSLAFFKYLSSFLTFWEFLMEHFIRSTRIDCSHPTFLLEAITRIENIRTGLWNSFSPIGWRWCKQNCERFLVS